MAKSSLALRSAKIKLTRARKHIKSIELSIAKYVRAHPYKVTNSKGKKTTKVTVKKTPPPEISVIAGEVIYQIRSALDHLIFGLIKKNPAAYAIEPDWERRCEFPIILKLPKGKTAPLKRKDIQHLPGISDPAFTFIESVQPYYVIGATNNALRIIGLLSNIDKHRRLNVVIGRIRKKEHIRLASGRTSSGFSMLDSGTEFPSRFNFSGDPTVYVNRRYSVAVHFGERAEIGDAGALAVDFLLKFLLEHAETTILPAFEVLL